VADEHTVKSRDCYVVNTHQLSGLLASEGVPSRYHRGQASMESLAHQSGVSPQTIEGIMRVRYPHTTLRVADNLVTAVGRTEVFYSGELPIDINPRASLARLRQIAADEGEDDQLRERAQSLLGSRAGTARRP